MTTTFRKTLIAATSDGPMRHGIRTISRRATHDTACGTQVMNAQIHFMKNLAILGGLLTVFAHGSGSYHRS